MRSWKRWRKYKGKTKTQEDQAREAMRLINDSGKRTDFENYVKDVEEDYANGVSCLVRLYNATGDTLDYAVSNTRGLHNIEHIYRSNCPVTAGDKDCLGYIGQTPHPTQNGNGQWASFLHVHQTAEATVVYRGKNQDGNQRDFIIAWAVPCGPCETSYVVSFEGRFRCARNLLNSDYSDRTNRGGIIIDNHTEKERLLSLMQLSRSLSVHRPFWRLLILSLPYINEFNRCVLVMFCSILEFQVFE
ncbi:hypothetical protein Cgig2_003785 [Carnegiea gigantea]|uniref:Uncharacterized protein n=1 Tax=Carnegiea gigantea TaxID=171969 RepID=A0A9Q1JPC8_9CARY|nr:hypothetical protein Cgig2_003785 [Carnegiea gigantea]